MLLKFFDELSRQIFVRFRLISLGGWLGLILDLRCLDSRFTLSRDILFYYENISIFCEDWPEPDKLVLTALQFSNINIFIRNFCHPRLPKKPANVPTRYFSPGPQATPPRCSTGMETTTTGTSTILSTARVSPFSSTWPREASCQVWRNILENLFIVTFMILV